MEQSPLLQPRYKIIAPWPTMPATLFVGKIITLDKFSAGKWWHEYTDDEPIHLDEGCTKYSANLKLLEYWEDLPIEQMPKYLRDVTNGEILKASYEIRDDKMRMISGKIDWLVTINTMCFYTPATEQEYKDQATKK